MRMIKTTLTVFALTGACFLTGCDRNTRSDAADTYEPRRTEAVATETDTTPAPVRRATPNTGTPAIETRRADRITSDNEIELTGIATCDDYLSSYKRCHAVAGVYQPELIDSRFAETRDALVKQSNDPAMSEDLDKRCTALASDLKEVLNGRDCLPADTVVTDDGVAITTSND